MSDNRRSGIILDMDGTLWDSAENVCRSWNIAVRRRGYDGMSITTEQMKGVMGLTMDRLGAALYPLLPLEERTPLLEECCRLENDYLREHGGILYPGVRETLEQLRKEYHISIVSNCQSGYIEAFLDHYGFGDLVDDRQCYGDNGLQKGENIGAVVRRNQLLGAVYVGDIQGDYEASRAAGVKFIHAAYGFGTIDAPVTRIARFSELPEAVRRVFAEA